MGSRRTAATAGALLGGFAFALAGCGTAAPAPNDTLTATGAPPTSSTSTVPTATAPTSSVPTATAPTTTTSPPPTSTSTRATRPPLAATSATPPPSAPAPKVKAPTAQAPAPKARAQAQAPAGTTLRVFLTGYTWYDNTPAGSAVLSHPVVHASAGGSGTWGDPLSLAVGHSLATGSDVLDLPAGTRVYLPSLARYAVVEDTCGDGPSPQSMACHIRPAGTDLHLDVWLNGSGAGADAAAACAQQVTDIVQAIVSPGPGLPVRSGPVSRAGGCG
ncbi:MAG: hypothetical protein ABI746_03950 [Dermatophilaceae bacterium]